MLGVPKKSKKSGLTKQNGVLLLYPFGGVVRRVDPSVLLLSRVQPCGQSQSGVVCILVESQPHITEEKPSFSLPHNSRHPLLPRVKSPM